MKNTSISMVLVALCIASGSMTKTYHRNDEVYRRGGFLGSGGVLGTGIGKDRPSDYYSTQPSVLQRAGNVAEDVVEGVADTAQEVVDDVRQPASQRYATDPYRRGYFSTNQYGQPRFVRQYSDGSYREQPIR